MKYNSVVISPAAARVTCFLGFLLASTPLWSLPADEARYLLNRTGFGASPSEIKGLENKSYEQAVHEIVHGSQSQPHTDPPSWVYQLPFPDTKPKDMTPEARMAFEKQKQEERMGLKAWWYQEMISTPSPFTERMTLFWHNHFTSSLEKVNAPVLMYRQNLILRQNALGNFRKLLTEMSRDPAMIIYLDTQSNHRGHPNENFARELLELFTLGEGHYTETDIKEAARAMTGWGVDYHYGIFTYHIGQHDNGEKTFMGQKGPWYGEDILRIVLTQPRVSEYIVEKLWREFISETPDPHEVQRLAALFRQNDYEIKPLLEALFLSPAFRDPKNRGVLTKSPVDLMVGTLRTFNTPIDDTRALVAAGRGMGQDILDPPNVKGWAGGQRWISTSTLLFRRQFLLRLLRGKEMETRPAPPSMAKATMQEKPADVPGMDLNEWMGKAHIQNDQDLNKLIAILLPIPPVTPLAEHSDEAHHEHVGPEGSVVAEIRALVLDPAYQLE